MYFTLVIEDESGKQINMTTTANQYMVSEIDGLYPPAGTISTSSYAGMDGSYLNHAFIEKRNLVITFQMRGIEIEKRRHALYRVVKPSRYIKVYYKTAGIDVYAEGYVETCEINHFEQQISGQISIICPEPYWYSVQELIATYTQVTSAFHFPFPENDRTFPLGVYNTTDKISIQNSGEESGIIMLLEASAREYVPEIAAVTPTIYNVQTGEYLQIQGNLLRGDVLTITTKTGNKTVTLTRNGTDTNAINRLVPGSTWLTLREGINTFQLEAARGVEHLKLTILHRDAYLGV